MLSVPSLSMHTPERHGATGVALRRPRVYEG